VRYYNIHSFQLTRAYRLISRMRMRIPREIADRQRIEVFRIRPPPNCTPRFSVGRDLAIVGRPDDDDEDVATSSRLLGAEDRTAPTWATYWPSIIGARQGAASWRADALPWTGSTWSRSGFRQSVARRPADCGHLSTGGVRSAERLWSVFKQISIYKRRIPRMTNRQCNLTKRPHRRRT